jgi:hypothetical protein
LRRNKLSIESFTLRFLGSVIATNPRAAVIYNHVFFNQALIVTNLAVGVSVTFSHLGDRHRSQDRLKIGHGWVHLNKGT